MGKRSNYPRRERDFYPTPYAAVLPLIPHLRGIRAFAEPCCGDGALVRHLESHGLSCTYAADITTGQDALAKTVFDSPVITNSPWRRDLLHPLIAHFIQAAPFSWLLIDSDWKETKQSRHLIRHCSHILPIGRVKWIPESDGNGKDNTAWYRFEQRHTAGPVLLPYRGDDMMSATHACRQCSAPYMPERTDSCFCSNACRQRAYRTRLAVTQA